MRGGGGLIPAQGELALAVGFEKTAPAAGHVEIDLDVSNLHTAPGRNLVVRVRLTLPA